MDKTGLREYFAYQERLDQVSKEFTLEQIEDTLRKVAKEAPNSKFHKVLCMLYMTKKFRSNWES